MTLFLLSPPGGEPVSLAEAKAFLRAGHDAEDVLIEKLLTSARERVEAETGRALIARTYRETLDGFAIPGRLTAQGRQFRLLAPPLIGVQSITLYDARDQAKVWDPEQYFVDAAADPGRIALRRRAAFPRPGRRAAGVEIVFDAGYGENAEDVPAALREAVLRLCADAYHNREGRSPPLPLAVQGLLAPYRRGRL